MSLVVAPNPIAFGTVSVSTKSVLTVSLTPADPTGASIESILFTGDSSLTVQQGLTVPPPSANTPAYGDSTNLAQGQSGTLTVTFAPTAVGSVHGVLRIGYNGPGSAYVVEVPVTGTGA